MFKFRLIALVRCLAVISISLAIGAAYSSIEFLIFFPCAIIGVFIDENSQLTGRSQFLALMGPPAIGAALAIIIIVITAGNAAELIALPLYLLLALVVGIVPAAISVVAVKASLSFVKRTTGCDLLK